MLIEWSDSHYGLSRLCFVLYVFPLCSIVGEFDGASAFSLRIR